MNPSKVIAILAGIIAVIALAIVLKAAQAVMLPIMVSVILSFVFSPLVKLLIRRGLPRIIAVFLVLVLLLGIFLLLGLFLITGIQSFVREYPVYLSKLSEIVRDFTGRYLSILKLPEDPLTGLDINKFLTDSLVSGSKALFSVLGVTAVIVVILIFMFLETSHFSVKLGKAYPSHTSRRIRIMMEHATRRIRRYLAVKILISLIMGSIVWVLLTLLGLDFPLVWGAVSFFLNFIPTIGYIIVIVLVGAQTFVQTYPYVGRLFIVAGVLIISFGLLNTLLERKLAGDRLSVSPLIVLASLLFWGWLWGVVGALISVPIAVSIKIVCDNVPALKPVGVLLGGRRYVRKKTPKSKQAPVSAL